MPRYEVPPKVGKVRVAVTLGNKYVVWNGKQGRAEFRIVCKNRRQAGEIAAKVNQMKQGGTIEVE